MQFDVKISAPDESKKTYVTNTAVDIRNGHYGKWEMIEKEFHFKEEGNAVYIEKIYTFVNTAEKMYRLYFYDAQGKKITVTFLRSDMTESGIMGLLAYGAQVNKKTAHTLLTSIFNQEPTAPCEMVHSTLGFMKYNEKIVFLGDRGVGIFSSYDGKLKIQPHGNVEKWKSMLQEEVLGTPMEVIIAIAATAPLVDFFKEDVHTGNILVSLVGESSTGKTCSGCLAVSLGSKPSFKGDSMIVTFGDSKNSLMHSIYSSYPLLIDEGSLIRSNQTALLYSLAEGKEKGRLDKELNKADAMVYSTSIFMTSEKSILRLCDQNTGLLVRCLEFEGVTWTRDAESADNIKQVCDSNYGFAIPLIAKKLVEIAENGQKEELLQYYQDCKKKLVQNARNKNEYNSLTERFMKILALIVTGAKIFTESVGVVLDKEMITSFILEHSAIADTEKLDIGNRALEYLCQYISLHHAKFIQSKEWKKDEVHVTPQECKGRIQKIGSKVLNNGETVNAELFISELVFGKILKEGGFQDEKVILKSWKEKGYLHCEKDRYCSKVEIVSQPAVKGYRIYLPVHQVEKIELKKPEGSKSLISRMRADALAKEKALAKEEMEEEVNFECDEDECSEDECFEDREIHSKEIKPLMKKLPRKPPRKPMPPSQVRLLNSKSPLKRLRKEEAEEETC